jgi:hypothetical protein
MRAIAVDVIIIVVVMLLKVSEIFIFAAAIMNADHNLKLIEITQW